MDVKSLQGGDLQIAMHKGAVPFCADAMMLYKGPLKLTDFYSEIDEGFSVFLEADYPLPSHCWRHTAFVLHIAPSYYFNYPIVEIIHYFLTKNKYATLSSMALTALHEAISNSLLWGLLQVSRSEDMFKFHHVIQNALKEKEAAHQTLTIALQTQPTLGVRLINPYDSTFDLEKFHTLSTSPYVRGSEIIRMFSHVDYDSTTCALNLMFGEGDDVYKAII